MILGEGLFLILFSQMNVVALAIISMTVLHCLPIWLAEQHMHWSFIDRNALGVAGIIGAGGNVGAVAAGFLLKGVLDIQTCLFILGGLVMVAGCSVILIRFTTEHKEKKVLLNRLYLNAIPQPNSDKKQKSKMIFASSPFHNNPKSLRYFLIFLKIIL